MSTPGWFPDPSGGPGNRYWNGHEWEEASPPADFPDEQHPKEQSKKRLLVPALVGLVGLMGGILLVLLWPQSETSEPSVPTPAASPTSTPTSTPTGSVAESAAAIVKESMQRDLDNDPNLGKLGLRVVDVGLINKVGNEYKGIASIRTLDGVIHDVAIDVTADGNDVIWETAPGAFLFVLDQTASPAPRKPPPVPPSAAPDSFEDFTLCPSGLTGVASEDTSCAFADSVRRAWYSSQGAVTITAYSPVTRQEYTMRCVPATTTAWPDAKRCSGRNSFGANLVVYIK